MVTITYFFRHYMLQVLACRAIFKVIKINTLCHVKGDPTHEEQLSPDHAGSMMPLVIVRGTAAVWRTLIGCLTGDKLCFCLIAPYLALSQMPGEATASLTTNPQPQVLMNQPLSHRRTFVSSPQAAQSVLLEPRDSDHSFPPQEACPPVSLAPCLPSCS